MVSTDSEVSARPELRSSHDGQDIETIVPSPEDLTHSEFVNQNQFGPFAESSSEAETASFEDSQDFLAIISQLNKTLENIKNQELLIQEGKTIYQSLYNHIILPSLFSLTFCYPHQIDYLNL